MTNPYQNAELQCIKFSDWQGYNHDTFRINIRQKNGHSFSFFSISNETRQGFIDRIRNQVMQESKQDLQITSITSTEYISPHHAQ
jgi:hypothetical protein